MTESVDLERVDAALPERAFDVIVVVHYLHRPLFPRLLAALRPGGVLVYETFTAAQAARGKPNNPDFLLRPGELHELVGSLEVLESREGEFDGRDVASAMARKRWRLARLRLGPTSMLSASPRGQHCIARASQGVET